MLVMEIILSKALGTDDLMVIFITLGLGIPAILVLTLAQWTTNTSNLYSSSLGLAVLFQNTSKKLFTLVAVIIYTKLAIIILFDHFVVNFSTEDNEYD